MTKDPKSDGVRQRWPRRLASLVTNDSPSQAAEASHEGDLAHRLAQVAVVMGMVAALVGAGHLAAWLSGYMSQRGFSIITMKTNTALCLTLVGVALMLLVPAEVGSARRWTARVCAVIALLVGLLTFMENLSGWDFGIDQLLAVETPGALGVASPNRMGTPASLSFTLFGLALLILSRRDHRRVHAAQALAVVVCLIALLSNIGFLYGAEQFYGIARYTGIAWPTAVALLLMGLGLLCARPAEGLMAQVTANDPGGVNIRRLLPAFVILPLLFGWLRLVGERAGVFDAPTGTGMMMLLFIIIFSVLTYHAGRGASRSASALRESEVHLARAQQIAYLGSWAWDIGADHLYWSDETYRLFGLQPREFVPRYEDFLGFVHPEDRPRVERSVQEALAHGPYNLDFRIVQKGGEERYVHSEGETAFDKEDNPVKMEGTVQDITLIKKAQEALRELNVALESKVAQRTAELQHRAKQLQKLTLELTQAEERERRRIAMILHEDLQQQIAGARFHLSLVRNRAREDRQRAEVDRVLDMLTACIKQSRGLSHDLSPAVLHMNDLAEVLGWLANRVREQHGLIAHVDVSGNMTLQSEPLTMFLFRAAQEMLFNVVKHARVNEAAIRVRRIGRYVCLCVSDQGRGFDPQELKETSGIGLFSIRERVELLGGRMTIKSAEGKGSRLHIVVPDGPKARHREQMTKDIAELRVLSSAAYPPSSGRVLRVLLVDDHEIVREGLASLLQETSDIAVVGEAADGREAINMAGDLHPDVVIMEVSMPVMSGDEATRQIKAYLPGTRVIALSMYEEADKMERMRAAGAEAYVLKTAPSEELLAAIRGD